VSVRFDALPGLDVEGKVDAIIPRADPQARTFPVKVRISNDEGRIGVGMLAEVRLPAGESYQATVVPKDAVITQGQENFVYLLDGEDTVHRTVVESGEGLGAWIVVKGGIEPGQRVVIRGNERLQEGQTVAGERMEYQRP
jgi:RND family efflux transporter MFP subunit